MTRSSDASLVHRLRRHPQVHHLTDRRLHHLDPRRRGYTMIEIGLGITLAVVIAAIALAGWQGIQTRQRQSETASLLNTVYSTITNLYRNDSDYGTAANDLIEEMNTAQVLPPRAGYTAATPDQLSTPILSQMTVVTCAGSVATCGATTHDNQYFVVEFADLDVDDCVALMGNFVSAPGATTSHMVGFAHADPITAARWNGSPFQTADLTDATGGCQTSADLRVVFR